MTFPSNKYTWDDYDKQAEKHECNRSQFLVYLFSEHMDDTKKQDVKTVIIFMMMGFIILALLIIYSTFWGP